MAVTAASSTGERTASVDNPDRWLAVAWPMAVLFHLGGNSSSLERLATGELDVIALFQLLVALLAVLTMATRHPMVGTVLAAGYAFVTWVKMPVVGNHEIILALTSLLLLVGAVTTDRGWLERAAPALRWLLLISYGAIAFSKLNHGFFDPAVSCAVVFGDELTGWLGFEVSGSSTLSWLSIVATVAIEAAIPVLLLVKRTRLLGVVLALTFHFLLALDPVGHVFDFSSTLFPLFLLFLPADGRTLLSGLVDRVDRRFGRFALAVAAVAAMALHLLVLNRGLPQWVVPYPLWLLVAATVYVTVIGFVARANGFGVSDRSAGVALAMVPLLLLAGANAVAPYLQLRTAAAFNMYSNLETVGVDSNHMFVPRTVALRPADLVLVESAPADHPLYVYVGGGRAVPIDNLRYWAANSDRSDNDRVLFRATGDGENRPMMRLADLEPTQDLLAHKFGYRRAVDQRQPARCLRSWGPVG